MITLVMVVVLSMLGYMLSSRVSAYRHRQKYVVDYQAARYGCESAIKFALENMNEISPMLISRPNDVDFSDLFSLTDEEIEELKADWAEELALREASERKKDKKDKKKMKGKKAGRDSDSTNPMSLISGLFGGVGGVNDANFAASGRPYDFNEPNSVEIPGPYGPPWPLAVEPVELEIASAKVTIEIEDENAKYPIGWMLLEDEKIERELAAGFETFCEWMDVNDVEIDSLKEQFVGISEIKQYKLSFEETKAKKPSAKERAKASKAKGRRQSRAARRRAQQKKTTIPASAHVSDFVNIFHSSLIDTDVLARATDVSDIRRESALKYMAMWGSTKINVNTAPRHVLETAFAFGGDAVEIADEIIERRRIEPFADLGDLKSSLIKYGVSVRKSEKYITTVSRFFTIRIRAVSGSAEVTAVIAITKDGNKAEKIALFTG